jgi:cytochrome c biogenesis protein CcmG, thiol:disulfide interchange protein DsbE
MLTRLLPLLGFIALAVLLYAGVQLNRTRDPNTIPSPFIDRPAPAFSLPSLREPERMIGNADLLGAPYLLNVWGSWCPACRVEHPLIERIARQGLVRVVGFNYKDDPDDAQRWLQQFGDPYDPIIVDRDGRNAIEWGIYGAPETFLVDAEGVIRYKHVGPMTLDVLEREIRPRLAEMRR